MTTYEFWVSVEVDETNEQAPDAEAIQEQLKDALVGGQDPAGPTNEYGIRKAEVVRYRAKS